MGGIDPGQAAFDALQKWVPAKLAADMLSH
jgi:hypothetical protein